MYNLKNYFIIIFLYLAMPSNVIAENKISYLDLDFILSNTNAGKSLFAQLNQNEKKILEKFDIEEKNLKDEEVKIIGSKNLISENELKKNVVEFQQKLKNFKKKKQAEIKNLKKIRNDKIINLLNIINPIIQEYMDDNSISILIDKKNIYIANVKLDITNNLIELKNKKIK